MMYDFFEPNEAEFSKIIEDIITKNNDKVISQSCISTGWTNTVIEVKSEKHEYIFRFPRTFFFAKEMLRDYTFCRLVYGKVSCETPDMQLCFDKNRPFSVHKKIAGITLSTLDAASFSKNEMVRFADGCGKFLARLHEIPVSQIPPEYRTKLSDYLAELADVHKGKYEMRTHRGLQALEKPEKDLCLVHGDFNSGNILVDDKLNILAVLDFSFASVSNRNADIGRFLSRTDMNFCKYIIESYNEYSSIPCNEHDVTVISNVFKYVDWKYIEYICNNHPCIEVCPKMRSNSFDMSIFADDLA